nr:PREDICTED: transmembrane 7 superfamily member 3 isoform X2 [Latimeria chalumnae]|eukprot:XP_014348669.1 PREDICTED: transmembrane 7 superfamily member 3 isoform X2 [Latimeria chalumnae]
MDNARLQPGAGWFFWSVVLLAAVWPRGDGTAPPMGLNRTEFALGRFQQVSLKKGFPVQAVLQHIPNDVSHVVFQLHTHYRNATVSFSKTSRIYNSGTGTGVGLLSRLKPSENKNSWYLQPSNATSVLGIAVIVPYSKKDPVPGGCNLEFVLAVDPNLYLQYNLYETVIKFAPADLGYARGATPAPCDVSTGQDSRWRLEYDVYQYFLPENDLSEPVLLSHLQKMVDVQQVKANGIKRISVTSHDKTIVSFSSIPGQGVIYNIIARDPLLNTSASYVPVHTYACSFTEMMDNCNTLGRISTKVFFTLVGSLGLFVCFFGHSYFKTVRLIVTAVAGLIGGGLLVLCWWRFSPVIFCMLIVELVLGFLVSSVIFFTPVGDFKLFRNDVIFWMVFTSIILFTMIFIIWMKVLNILACGIVGSYTVILAIDSYLYTSLSYITLNVLKRALNNDFSRAYTNVPFQVNDFIMITVWVVLAVCGTVFQIQRERNKPAFPPNPYLTWKRDRERRRTNILDPSYHIPPLRERIRSKVTRVGEMFKKEQPAGERTPLLM